MFLAIVLKIFVRLQIPLGKMVKVQKFALLLSESVSTGAGLVFITDQMSICLCLSPMHSTMLQIFMEVSNITSFSTTQY